MLPTFSLLISTTAFFPTACKILFARVLNAPHCLHASTSTFFPAPAGFFFSSTLSSFLAFFAVTFFLGAAFTLACSSFFAGDSVAFLVRDLVTLPIFLVGSNKVYLLALCVVSTAEQQDYFYLTRAEGVTSESVSQSKFLQIIR